MKRITLEDVKEYSRFMYTDNGRTIIDFGDYTVFGMIEGE